MTRLSSGAELRVTGRVREAAVVCVNGGQAREVAGTWSASVEWLVRRLAPEHPALALAEVRYRVKSWNRFELCVEDARAAVAEVGAPRTLLLGFSMGGAVAISVANEPSVEGVLGLAPWIPDALELDGPSVQLFLVGGEYRPDRMDTIGPLAMTALNQVRGYTAFIGADGISMDFGPSANDLASADLHRLVVTNAAATVLLVDHSKFGGASLFQIIDWSHVDTVATDKEPDDAWKQFFAEKEINLVFPGSNGEETDE